MVKRLVMGLFGGQKTKKTRFAASVFTSTHIDPAKVLYCDNHDSTISLSLPAYNKKTYAGVLMVTDADGISKVFVELQRKMARGNSEPMLDAIVIDDFTTQSAMEIAKLSGEANKSGETGMNISKWGTLRTNNSSLYRRAKMVAKHVIIICRSDWQGDPAEKPDKGAPVDTRNQKMQPLLEGGFGRDFRYDVSLLVYTQKEVKKSGKTEFTMLLQPTNEIMVENRLWEGEPKEVVEPTFDQILEIVQSKEGE